MDRSHMVTYVLGHCGFPTKQIADQVTYNAMKLQYHDTSNSMLPISRYYASFLKKNLEMLDGKLRQYVQWCLDNCKYTKVSPRQYPPSSVEVAVSFFHWIVLNLIFMVYIIIIHTFPFFTQIEFIKSF